jgi:drug/metabolite transporter (DMT)-like permease
MAASAGLLLIPALATAPSTAPGLGPVAALVALGVVGTGAAFLIFYRLIATVGPARTMIVSYVAPGFAVVYGATLLGEAITAATVVGLALIVAGSWLAAGGNVGSGTGKREGLPKEALDTAPRP